MDGPDTAWFPHHSCPHLLLHEQEARRGAAHRQRRAHAVQRGRRLHPLQRRGPGPAPPGEGANGRVAEIYMMLWVRRPPLRRAAVSGHP